MLDNLITAIKNNVPVEVEREVSAELSSRTSALLDTRKKEVAYSLFNRVDGEEEKETDVDTTETDVDTTEIENDFVDKIKGIEENTKVVFKDKSHFIVDKDTANAFVKLYESASGLNGKRLVKIATKSKRGFLKVIQLTR